MSGELNPKEIALNSFEDFRTSLGSVIEAPPQAKKEINKIQLEAELRKREQAVYNSVAKTDSQYAFGKSYDYQPEKLSWKTRNYDIGELYTTLSDGSLYKNFDTYTPGINNYEDKARNQGTGERLLNLSTKFFDTALTNIVGGTAGLIYSIPNAISEGKLSALYDNDFMQALDLHQEKMAVDYKQYVTAEDKKDFFNWELADNVAQGVAFTAGALATDALWAYATGGTSLATSGARWAARIGKIADKTLDATRYLDDMTRVANIGRAEAVMTPFLATNRTLQRYATIGGKVGAATNVLRSAFTGAGFEAGFEARAYRNEARRDYKEQFKATNGVEPTAEEMKQFEENLDSTANGLYAFNLAVVGTSHVAQFGSLLNLKLPSLGITRAINKKLFGVGLEIAENAPRAIVATGRQRAAQIGWSLSKGAIREGLVEEGLQSVGNNTAHNMIKQTYNPKESYSLVEATMKGFAETYGTKEGLHEVAVGMLVGALTGNALGIATKKTLAHEFADENKRNSDIEKTFGKNATYTANTAINNMIMANRVIASKKAEENANKKGDWLGGQLARGGMLQAQFQRGKALNFLDEQTEMLSKSIDLIDTETLAKEQGVSLEEADGIKESMKTELFKEKERFDRISTFTDYFIGGKINNKDFEEFFNQYEEKNKDADKKLLRRQASQMMKQALTYELYMGELSYEHADEMLGAYKNELQNLLGSDNIRKAIDIHDVINKSKLSTQRKLNKTRKDLESTVSEFRNIEGNIRELEAVVNNATTPEQRQSSLSRLNELTLKRDELLSKRDNLTREFNTLKNSAKLESKFGQNTEFDELTSDEILGLQKNIDKTLETIDQLKTVDFQRAQRLEKLLKEYEKSVVAYKKFTERTNQMMDLGQGLRGKRNILAQLVLDTNPNQATKDMIKGLLDTHYEKSQYNPDDISDTIQNLKSKEEESQEEGVSMNPIGNVQSSSLQQQLSSLDENSYYITHITSDNNAVNIYNSSLNMSAGVSSTTGIVTKQGLIDLINNLEKGISPHRGYLDLFIGKIDKSTLDSENGRTLQDKLENYLDNNFIEDVAKTQLPASFNFGYYSNGNLVTKQIKKDGSILEYIKQTIKDNPYLLEQIGDNVEDTLPTDEELIEYIELYSPVLDNPDFNSAEFTYNTNEQTDSFKKYLSPEEIDRLKELNTKFANWQLIESIGSEGISLADLIQQEALSRQEVRKVETEADVNETVLETASKEVDENGERRFDILQTIENVFVVDNKARTHKLISHMTPKKFFELIGETGQLEVVYYDSSGKQIDKPVKTTVENINNVVKPNSKIHFGNSFIEITRGMRIKYRNDLGVNLNTRVTKSGYSLVFDNEGSAMLSDFQDVNTYSPQEIFGVKAGDELELRVEDNDFNLSLNEDELLDNLQISIYKDGVKIGDLKANYGEGEKSEFLKIRQKAKNIFTDTDTQTVGFIKANNVFLGTPNLKLGENGTEQLFDVVEEAVKDYGYWDGSKLGLKNNSKPRTDLLKDVKTNTPVIVIEENGMPIAYPAVLKVEDKNLGTEIMNKGLSKGQLVLELNRALKENGIETNLYYISDENTNMFELDGKTSALLEDYIAKLDKVQDKADFKDDLTKLQVNIDLNGNRFFLSPKLAVDLSSFKEVANVQTQETVSEDVLKLHNYKNELLKLSNKNQSQSFNKQAVKIDDTTLRMEGVTKKFIQIKDDIYVYSESNKSHAKWVRDYNSGIEQALDLIQSKLTKYKEADIFRDYNKIQAEIDNLERDFLTKAEYEDYLDQLKRKEDSEQGKKC